MKGIILAGGNGTRLYPLTRSISKQLLPVYDKPMIYYPLSTLLLAGIKEILIISTPKDIDKFKNLLGDGGNIGISISYKEQPNPDGLAQAFILGEDFIGNDDVCLILGDNIFYGHGLPEILKESVNKAKNQLASVYGYHVYNPQDYGVVEFDNNHQVISIEEKPERPKSDYAITGIYFYPNTVIEAAKSVKPSQRGELEITSVNQTYLNQKKLSVDILGRGFTWLDMGSHENLLEASVFIETIERRQGLKIACIEEIAFNLGYIDKNQLKKLALSLDTNQYGKYLQSLYK